MEGMMDAIIYWNAVAQEADRVTHTTGDPRKAGARGPAGSSRAFAMAAGRVCDRDHHDPLIRAPVRQDPASSGAC
jgi:hypothetical protein